MNMNAKRFTWLKKDGYAPQIVITDSLTEKDLTPTDCYELLNELAEENEQLKKQMQRLYNYFVDWHEDIMGANQFSEMWDNVKEDEDWEY